MKVAAVTPLYPPASLVGAWISTHQCLRALVEAGHRVNVLQYMNPAAPYELDGVTVCPKTPASLAALAEADVIVSHLGDNNLAARLAAGAGVPLVRMVHGHHDEALARLREFPTALAVFNSESLRIAIGWDGPSLVLPPPIDPEQYRTTPGDRVTLVNTSSEKGGETLNLIAAAMPHVSFLAVRGAYGRQRTRRRDNVEVVGSTTDMAADVYARTNILLMPSERETYGRVAIEAACSGIPTIAHPTPGLLESLGDAGIFVDRNDITGWCSAISDLLVPWRWDEASARARARAAQLTTESNLQVFVSMIEHTAAVSCG